MERIAAITKMGMLTVVAFAMVSTTSVRAQNTAPLAPGEVLLQLQESVTLLEPIGSIKWKCQYSAVGKDEATALAALAKQRNLVEQQLSKRRIPVSVIIVTEKPSLQDDYSYAAQNVADVVTPSPPPTNDENRRITPMKTTPVKPEVMKKATQEFAFHFTSYSQFEQGVELGYPIECGRYDAYSRSRNPIVVESVDPEGASRRARMQVMAEVRKRAESYADSMNMKVARVQRVSEVGELAGILGPELTKNFRRIAANEAVKNRGALDPRLISNKVEVTEGLFVDFVLGPK